MYINILYFAEYASHPSWVRGLKQDNNAAIKNLAEVAPLVGAWIETLDVTDILLCSPVAPLVGAWIETRVRQQFTQERIVAPLVGAWIETQLDI